MRKITVIFILFNALFILPIKSQFLSDSVRISKDSLKTNRLVTMNALPNASMANIPQVIPPAPESRLYEQYVNCPVGYETGVPEITVPLYEIEVDGLKIPINLSYHASGIRYKQYDGDVAAGWVLNPGYRLTRTMFNKPDEAYSMHPTKGNEEFEASSRQTSYWRDRYLASFSNFSWNAPISENGGYYDSEFDHFCYMLPSGSAHFIIPDISSKNICILEKANYKIDFDIAYTQIKEFNITDDNGFVYKMGGRNELTESSSNGQDAFISAWPLTKIASPKGRSIDFDYVRATGVYTDANKGRTIYYDAIEHPAVGKLTGSAINTGVSDMSAWQYRFLLTEINTDKELVKIIRDMSQYNYSPGNGQIQSIEIYQKIPQLVLLKKIKFNYSPRSLEYQRMLESIEIYGSDTTKGPQYYKFDYYQGISYRNSYPDQWGYYHYYSGATHSTMFFHKEFVNNYWNTVFNGPPDKVYSSYTGNYPSDRPFPQIGSYVLAERRSNNTSTLHAYSLKSITYPTGGRWEFEYEPNQFLRDKAVQGAGQRIKQISMYDSSNKAKILQYKYGKNESGNGIVSFDPVPEHFAQESVQIEYKEFPGVTLPMPSYAPAYIRTYSTHMLGNASVENHFSIYYPEVTEYAYNESKKSDNGKTVRMYESSYNTYTLADIGNWDIIASAYSPGFGSNNNTGAYIGEYRYGYKPRLTSVSTYSLEGQLYSLKYKETLKYTETSNNNSFKGFNVRQVVSSNHWETPDLEPSAFDTNNPYDRVNSFYYHFDYDVYTGTELLTEKTETNYFPSGNVTKIYNYNYNDKLQLVRTDQTGNRGNLVTENKYPHNYTESIYQTMVSKNMISPVIEQITTNNGQEIGRIKTDYSYNPTSGIIAPSQISTSASGVNNLRRDIIFDKYDDKGNILQYTTLDGISTTYLWSYNYEYPIAEIKNATYEQVKTALGESLETLAASSIPLIMDKINTLRNKLPNSIVSTYSYKPLTGIQKATDARGISTYFGYENFGRLAEIRNNDKQLQSDYIYQFANQQASQPLPVYQPLNMALAMTSGTNPALMGTGGTFKATVSGGSGQYKYLWYVNGVLKAESSSNQYTVQYTSPTNYTITCKVVDLSTQEVVEKSTVVSIQYPQVTVENYVCDYDNAIYRADIICDIETDITFQLVYTKNSTQSDQAEFSIGEFIILKSGQEVTKTVKFKKGTTSIYLNLKGDRESHAYVEFLNVTNASFNSNTVFTTSECF